MAELQPQGRPWEAVELTKDGQRLARSGKNESPWSLFQKPLAFKDPETGNVQVFTKGGSYTLSPDQKGLLGHITWEEITNFVKRATANKK